MRHTPAFDLTDVGEIERLIRENPWATLVSDGPEGLVASHYPVLLDESVDGISLLTHVGRPDEAIHGLGDRELLVVVQGPHGYVSSSWYGTEPAAPTWNFISAHLSGVPEVLSEAENLDVLERLVAHFEGRVERPNLLRATPEAIAYAERAARGTVGLRLTPTRITAKRKMSQNRSPEIVETIRAELTGAGPYANPALEREMAIVHD